LESEAFSALDTGAAGRVVDVAGESFASLGVGVSSFTSRDSGSTMALSLSVGTCNVTVRLDLLAGLVLRRVPLLVPLTLPPDLRRSLARTALLAEDPMGWLLVLLEGGNEEKGRPVWRAAKIGGIGMAVLMMIEVDGREMRQKKKVVFALSPGRL
jgi:hypothetical protein